MHGARGLEQKLPALPANAPTKENLEQLAATASRKGCANKPTRAIPWGEILTGMRLLTIYVDANSFVAAFVICAIARLDVATLGGNLCEQPATLDLPIKAIACIKNKGRTVLKPTLSEAMPLLVTVPVAFAVKDLKPTHEGNHSTTYGGNAENWQRQKIAAGLVGVNVKRVDGLALRPNLREDKRRGWRARRHFPPGALATWLGEIPEVAEKIRGAQRSRRVWTNESTEPANRLGGGFWSQGQRDGSGQEPDPERMGWDGYNMSAAGSPPRQK
eukprot:g1161.t1